MARKNRFKLIVFVIILFTSGCWCATGDLAGVPAGQFPTVTPKPPTEDLPPTLTPTLTPEPEENICSFFDNIVMEVVQQRINPEDLAMTWYIKMPGGVPGLELDDLGDHDWAYQIKLGDLVSDDCKFLGFEERLYCFLPVERSYEDSLRPFKLMVAGCTPPILDISGISVLGVYLTPTPVIFDDIPVDCGEKPSDSGCSVDFEKWCVCQGGAYQCLPPGLFDGDLAVCAMP